MWDTQRPASCGDGAWFPLVIAVAVSLLFSTWEKGLAQLARVLRAHNKVLHEEVVILSVVTEDVPRVPRERRVETESLGDGLFRVVARFGFMEEPHVPHALLQARPEGTTTTIADTSFFLGRERFLPRDAGGLSRWRGALFAFLSRNAVGATEYFHIPPERVIELGAQVSL